MENVTHALKMAAAVLVFVLALSVAIFAFSKVRATAAQVLANSDRTQYYDAENLDIRTSRLVGIETVIPTLYSYFDTGYTILFYTGTLDSDGKLGNMKPMTLYYSESAAVDLAKSKLTYNDGTKSHTSSYIDSNGNPQSVSRAIYGFNLEDETIRSEHWTEINEKREMIRCFINSKANTDYESYNYSTSREKPYDGTNAIDKNKKIMHIFYQHYKSMGNKSLAESTDALFVERFGTYMTSKDNSGYNTTGDTLVFEGYNVVNDGSKVTFSNNEVTANDEGTYNKLIQYIYITNRKK